MPPHSQQRTSRRLDRDGFVVPTGSRPAAVALACRDAFWAKLEGPRTRGRAGDVGVGARASAGPRRGVRWDDLGAPGGAGRRARGGRRPACGEDRWGRRARVVARNSARRRAGAWHAGTAHCARRSRRRDRPGADPPLRTWPAAAGRRRAGSHRRPRRSPPLGPPASAVRARRPRAAVVAPPAFHSGGLGPRRSSRPNRSCSTPRPLTRAVDDVTRASAAFPTSPCGPAARGGAATPVEPPRAAPPLPGVAARAAAARRRPRAPRTTPLLDGRAPGARRSGGGGGLVFVCFIRPRTPTLQKWVSLKQTCLFEVTPIATARGVRGGARRLATSVRH